MGQPRPLFVYVRSFSTKQYNFYNESMRKMSCTTSIWCWDLNPQPLIHESSPITTRPGLPPLIRLFRRRPKFIFSLHRISRREIGLMKGEICKRNFAQIIYRRSLIWDQIEGQLKSVTKLLDYFLIFLA